MSRSPEGTDIAAVDGGGQAALTPPRAKLWILSPTWDLLLFVATPLLILPSIFLARTRWAPEEIYLFVASFGAVGHHLPGMIRAYGDRDLFARFKTRFIVAPLFLIATCCLFTLRDMSGIVLVVYMWGVWHGLMQTYGFLRIYDSKVGSFAQLTSRLDHWMCLAWFGGAVILSPTRSHNVLTAFYKAGGPLIPASAIEGLRIFAVAALVVVNVLFVFHAVRMWRRGSPPSPVKLLLMATSFGFWWYANVMVEHLLVGIALFEIFHDVQYLSIVWMFNQKRTQGEGNLTRFVRFLFQRSSALVGVYVGLVFAYGSMNYVAQGLPVETLKQALVGLLLASTLLHFYYDGFIWKVREKSTRKSLGLAGGREEKTPGWLVHALRWSFFVIPLAWLGVSEVQGLVPSVDRARALAAALPDYAVAQYNYGVELAARGEVDDAIRHYKRAVELDPEFGDAYYNLANALAEQDKTEEAIEMYRLAARFEPESAGTRVNLANIFLRRGDAQAAIDEYREAVRLRPDLSEAHSNLANALAAAGRPEEALRHYREAVESDPDSAQGRYNLAAFLTRAGRPEEAIAEYRRAVELDPDFAEAHFNLANAYFRAGRLEEAIAHYRQVLRIGEDPEARFQLGNALLQQGKTAEAAAAYREVIAVEPELAEAHHNLAVALLQAGRLEEALPRLREAIRLKPAYADAHRNLGKALASLGRREEADRHLAEAGRLAGNTATWD